MKISDTIFVNPIKIKNLKLADLYKETPKSDWKEIVEIHHHNNNRSSIFYQNLDKLPKVTGGAKVYHNEQVVECIKHNNDFLQHSTYYSEIKLKTTKCF